MSATADRFIDITSFVHGSNTYTGVVSVSYESDTKEIAASSDADKTDTFLAKGKTTVRGSVRFNDPVQAAQFQAEAAADLTFKGTGPGAAPHAVVTVVVKGCTPFNLRGNAMHDDVWTSEVTFRGFMVTGAAMTVTET